MGEIVVAITGASGAIYGKRLLEILQQHGKDTRLVVSHAGEITLNTNVEFLKKNSLKPPAQNWKTRRISVANPPQVQQKSMRL